MTRTLLVPLALGLLAIALPAPAAAEPTCHLDGALCTDEYHWGDACGESGAMGHHESSATVSAADARATLARSEICGRSRDGTWMLESTSVAADAAGASVYVEYVDFQDNYWNQYLYVYRGVYAEAALPDGTVAYAFHDESGFTDPTFPDRACYTGAGVDDGEPLYVSCGSVPPLIFLP